jgi:hypothetical protein
LPIAGTTLGPSGTTAFVPERGKWLPTQYGWAALTPEQWNRAEPVLTTTDICATTWDGQDLNDDPNSPVLLVGHSYLWQFDKHFARELNMRINVHAVAARTTEVFRDFLREPDLLAHCRVVVWITTGRDWPRFPPLPPEITGATAK